MFLKNKNIIFKIRRSKVTDYAALSHQSMELGTEIFSCSTQLRFVRILIFNQDTISCSIEISMKKLYYLGARFTKFNNCQ